MNHYDILVRAMHDFSSKWSSHEEMEEGLREYAKQLSRGVTGNFTRPGDPDHVDSPEDWLNSALLFGMAAGLLLEEGTGVVVDVKGEAFNPIGDSKKVIVFNKDGKLVIDDFEQDLAEGSICRIIEQ